jgi:tetratricopeptide (TPR) repeat protein
VSVGGLAVLSILVSLPAARPLPQESEPRGDRIAELLAELDGPGVEGARAALDELLELAEPAASAALVGFSDSGLAARRLRARLVQAKGGDDCIRAVAGWTADPDREVRASMVAFLGERLRAATSTGFDELGFDALSRTAREDPEVSLRLDALRALARSDHALATRTLESLALELTPPERTLAANALAEQPRGRSIVVERVQAAFAGKSGALPPDVLAVWMGTYGTRLAEQPQGGIAARDRAPFLVARRHPEPSVRLAARVSLERFLLRLVELGDPERGEAVLDQLIAAEPANLDLASRRASYTLVHGADASGALRHAREVSRRALTTGGEDEAPDRVAAAVGFVLEAAALVSLELPREARQPLGRARALLDGLAAERLELQEDGLALLGAALFEQRAVVELYFALCLFQEDGPQAEALEHARRAHVLSLEAQLSKTKGPLTRLTGDLNAVVSHPLSPFALLFQNQRQRAVGRDRVLELELRLCRALAQAAPIEMPGFAETPETKLDDERWSLLDRILNGLEDQVDDMVRKAEDPDQAQRLRFNILLALEVDEDEPSQLLKLRVPCSYGLERAGTLREEGRAAEARELAQRMLAHLDRVDFTLEAEEGERLRMSTQMAIGTSLTDEGEPRQAEQMLLKALERAEAIERGRSGSGLRVERANILISLAVNANVKLGDSDKALGYFERAFELEDNEFTRTLLACYRARAGRTQEAREALKQTIVSPQNYYNLACTHALLGDRDRAIELLRRALDENFLTPGSRERQKTWARDDPDLSSLRGDPRFEALLRR